MNVRNLPGSLARRSLKCSLLDVAVGSGSVEVVKCLREVHGAKPSRETLRIAISTGNLELLKVMRCTSAIEGSFETGTT
jgi:hypothetical protein